MNALQSNTSSSSKSTTTRTRKLRKATMEDVLAAFNRYACEGRQGMIAREVREGGFLLPEQWGTDFGAARSFFFYLLEELRLYASHHGGVDMRVVDALTLDDELLDARSRYVKVFCIPSEPGTTQEFAVLDARRRDRMPRLWVSADDLYGAEDPQAPLCALLDVFNACPAALRKMGATGEPDEHDEELATFQYRRRTY